MQKLHDVQKKRGFSTCKSSSLPFVSTKHRELDGVMSQGQGYSVNKRKGCFCLMALAKGFEQRDPALNSAPPLPCTNHPPTSLTTWTHFRRVTLSDHHHRFRDLPRGSTWEFCDIGTMS